MVMNWLDSHTMMMDWRVPSCDQLALAVAPRFQSDCRDGGMENWAGRSFFRFPVAWASANQARSLSTEPDSLVICWASCSACLRAALLEQPVARAARARME